MRRRDNRLSVSQALEGFLLAKAAEGRSPKTLRDYRYCAAMLTDWLQDGGRGDPPIEDLSTDDLRRFFVELRKRKPPLSAKTVRNVYVALSSLWSWLGEEFGLPHIVKPVHVPQAHPPAMRLPTREEVERLLKACDRTEEYHPYNRRAFRTKRPTGLRDRAIILVLLDTGLRAAELCDLTLADVDLADGSVLVRHGKGNKQRLVYLGKATRKVVWRYMAAERKGAEPNVPLFVGRGEEPLTVGAISHLVHDLGRRVGINVHPHLLRHVFATEFLRAGGTTLALRRLLGHVSDALLARYAEIVEADLRAAHEAASPADRWRL